MFSIIELKNVILRKWRYIFYHHMPPDCIDFASCSGCLLFFDGNHLAILCPSCYVLDAF